MTTEAQTDDAGTGAPADGRIATAVIRLETIPRPGTLDGEAWTAWCAQHGIHPRGSGRRGWFHETGSYLRGATWIGRIEGDGAPLLLDDAELAALQAWPRCGGGIDPGTVHDPLPEDPERGCVARQIPNPRPQRARRALDSKSPAA